MVHILRTSTSLTTEDLDRKLEITEDLLRDRLSKWRQFHQDFEIGKHQLRQGQKDLYAEIERARALQYFQNAALKVQFCERI